MVSPPRAFPPLFAILVIAASPFLGSCGSSGGGGETDTGTDEEEVTDVPVETGCTQDGDCDDGDPCTADACETDSGECLHDEVDADGDGYVAESVDGTSCGGTDCDDSDDGVFPGAPPDCSGGDADCDGLADGDEDGDGHLHESCGGDDCDDDDPDVHPGTDMLGCFDDDRDCNGIGDGDNDDDGHVAERCEGDDCDDGDPAVYWGAEEIECDGKDTNCDGWLTETEDVDRDGWGSVACGGDDCDDDDPDVHPDATEVCDTVDDDCDGTWADGGADDDGDEHLDASCGGDDCDDEDPDAYGGNTEVCDGKDNDCDGAADEPDLATAPALVISRDAGVCVNDVVWTGSEHAAVWLGTQDGDAEVYVSTHDTTGTPVVSEVRLTDDAVDAGSPSLVWTGSELGVTWHDLSSGSWDIQFARVDASGSVVGSAVNVSGSIFAAQTPDLAWTGSEFAVVWEQFPGGGADYRVDFQRISADGVPAGGVADLSASPASCGTPAIVWSGSHLGVAWRDGRIGFNDIFFAVFDPTGTRIGSETAVTSGLLLAMEPRVAWTGSEFALAWTDPRHGNMEIMHARMAADGSVVVSDVRISDSTGVSASPALTVAGNDALIPFGDLTSGTTDPWIGHASLLTGEARAAPLVTTAHDSYNPRVSWTGSELAVMYCDNAIGWEEVWFATLAICPF
jgi:hypothetical protein